MSTPQYHHINDLLAFSMSHDTGDELKGVMVGDNFYTYDGDVFCRLRKNFTRPANITQPTTSSGPLPTDTPQSTTPSPSLSTDVAALHSMINTLRAELTATITVNNHLAASVARLQAEQTISTPRSITPTPAATPTPDHATTPTTVPLPCSHPQHPRTIASGRGAASPEVFQEIIKTNWHGRLGRTHMVDVDALSSTALTELDCLLRRKLHAIYRPGREDTALNTYASLNTDAIFASLAVLGLRLEDRSAYVDRPVMHDSSVRCKAPTIKRGRNSVAWKITKEIYADYWEGVLVETMLELAEYRGLFDDEGYLKDK